MTALAQHPSHGGHSQPYSMFGKGCGGLKNCRRNRVESHDEFGDDNSLCGIAVAGNVVDVHDEATATPQRFDSFDSRNINVADCNRLYSCRYSHTDHCIPQLTSPARGRSSRSVGIKTNHPLVSPLQFADDGSHARSLTGDRTHKAPVARPLIRRGDVTPNRISLDNARFVAQQLRAGDRRAEYAA